MDTVRDSYLNNPQLTLRVVVSIAFINRVFKGRSMRYCGLSGLLLVVFIFGCNDANRMKSIPLPEEESAAKGYIDLLRQENFEEIEKHLDPGIIKPDIRYTLSKMAQLIPDGLPESIKIVRTGIIHDSKHSTTDITFEYQFENKWLLINVATQTIGGGTTITGFSVTEIADSLENINKFHFTGKTIIHYAVFVLAIFIHLFILYALVLCIKTRMKKRKWLWILFILVGLELFSFNWTTGQMDISWLYIRTGIFIQYNPVIIRISLPLGAIIFLLKRKRLMKLPDTVELSDETLLQDAVNRLAEMIPGMQQAGLSSEQIAKTLHDERRTLGVKLKDVVPGNNITRIYTRNIEKYGDKLGPSVEWLRESGKSWDDIINSAISTNGKGAGFK